MRPQKCVSGRMGMGNRPCSLVGPTGDARVSGLHHPPGPPDWPRCTAHGRPECRECQGVRQRERHETMQCVERESAHIEVPEEMIEAVMLRRQGMIGMKQGSSVYENARRDLAAALAASRVARP